MDITSTLPRAWLKAVNSLMNCLNQGALWLGGIALMMMAIHVSLDAFGKYLLSTPIPATLEVVAYYYMPAVAALPIAYVQTRGGHVSVEMLFNYFPGWLQRVTLVVNDVISLAFVSLITWLALREGVRKFEIGEYMFGEYPLIIWPGRFIFTAGLLLMSLILLVSIISAFMTPWFGQKQIHVQQQGGGMA